MNHNIEQQLPKFNDADLSRPLLWIETLSDDELFHWLAHAIWTRNTLPLVDSRVTDFANQLAHLVSSSTELKPKFWRVIPILLRSWARNDPAYCLDDLLVLAARLRCAKAEPDIIRIARERLAGHPDEVNLRQRCLSVLAGIGPTENSLKLFEDYIHQREYAPLCYRALYRMDPNNRFKKIGELLQLYRRDDATSSLITVLEFLLRYHLKSFPNQYGEQVNFIEQALLVLPDNNLTYNFLWVLKKTGFELRPDRQKNVFRVWDKLRQQEIGEIKPDKLREAIISNIENIIYKFDSEDFREHGLLETI